MSENEEREIEDKLHQFQRNKYFYGKLMTVRDFELEQEYFNGKRHLLNRLIHGKGLLYGFSDLELSPRGSDELDILFRDGGVALDSLGREIVVPEDTKKNVLNENKSPLKKLELEGTIYLYLSYSLSPSELIRAASNPLSCNEITCPNRILEDFEVIASSKYPANKEEYGSLSHTAIAESNEKVFFAAVKEDLSVDEHESRFLRHNLQTQRQGTDTMSCATGVVYFMNPTMNSITSKFIDPELGKEPFIQLGLEITEEKQILTGYCVASKKRNYPQLQLGTILDTSSGKFKVKVVFADERERMPIKVRWWAYRAGEPQMDEISEVSLAKYKFVSDPKVEVKIVENGLSSSGAKNYITDGMISGGDHYAKVGNDVALNGNPKKLAVLIREQDDSRHPLNSSTWEVGGGWALDVDNFDNIDLKKPVVKIRLSYGKKELRLFNVSKGDLITYCEDIAGETEVPLFVTYVDDIYVPGKSSSWIGKEAKVFLKYTWAVSKNVRYQE